MPELFQRRSYGFQEYFEVHSTLCPKIHLCVSVHLYNWRKMRKIAAGIPGTVQPSVPLLPYVAVCLASQQHLAIISRLPVKPTRAEPEEARSGKWPSGWQGYRHVWTCALLFPVAAELILHCVPRTLVQKQLLFSEGLRLCLRCSHRRQGTGDLEERAPGSF